MLDVEVHGLFKDWLFVVMVVCASGCDIFLSEMTL